MQRYSWIASFRANALLLGTLSGTATVADAQSVSLDNVPPIALAVSPSLAAVSINPLTGNVTTRSFSGGITQCVGSETAPAFDKAIEGGNTGFAINQSGRIQLLTAPISYLNRTVGQGRRVVSLRVSQPVLCVDFAPTPGSGSNPVGLKITDPNSEAGAVLYGGITSFDYVTNGVGLSSFNVVAGAQLACCTMLPASNAGCFQGGNGGLLGTPPGTDKGGAANLEVVMSGPGGVLPGANLAYAIVVTNTGGTTISGVRVRDWYQKSSSGFAVAFSDGSWNCTPTAGASCGTAGGVGNIALTNASLGAGTSVVITVNRTLSAFAPLGSPYSVSAVAFAPPATNETVLSDNQAVLNGVAQITDDLFAGGFE